MYHWTHFEELGASSFELTRMIRGAWSSYSCVDSICDQRGPPWTHFSSVRAMVNLETDRRALCLFSIMILRDPRGKALVFETSQGTLFQISPIDV